MAYHPFRHLGLKFISIALAVLIWLVVSDQQLVERSVRAPLEFHNVPEGLEIVDDPPETIDVRLRGTSSALARLLPGEVIAVLNLQNARVGARLFHLQTDQVRVPYGVQVSQVTPASVPLTFELTGSRLVPVVPGVEGEPAPGFTAGRISSEPAVVEVIGPVSRLQQLKHAITEPVVITKATTTVRERVAIGVTDERLRLREPRMAVVTVEITPTATEKNLSQAAPAGSGVRLRP